MSGQSHQRLQTRAIFVLVDEKQYCWVSHSIRPAKAIATAVACDKRWIGYAVVERILGTFYDAGMMARVWRAVGALNSYETVGQPRVLVYVTAEPLFELAKERAAKWPFKIKTHCPQRPLSPRDERFLKRDRSIYVIADLNYRCYVGQSVHPRQRVAAHFAGTGTSSTEKWLPHSIEPTARIVEVVNGNYWDAQWAEYKWRRIAELNGYENVDIDGVLYVYDEVERSAEAEQASWPFLTISK
jgi:hypothetical protein